VTPQEILPLIQGAKILASGANLTIPNNVNAYPNVTRAVLHGWVKVEVAGKIVKFPENRKAVTIKRRLLGAIYPGANLNAIRSRELREAFDHFIELVKAAADNAAEARQKAEAPQIEQKVQKVVSERQARMKKQAYANGCQELEKLFQGALFEMAEDELLEIFRLNRVKHVMDS